MTKGKIPNFFRKIKKLYQQKIYQKGFILRLTPEDFVHRFNISWNEKSSNPDLDQCGKFVFRYWTL